MLPPFKTPRLGTRFPVAADEGETLVLDRPSRKSVTASHADDTAPTMIFPDATGDEFTRILPKNLGELSSPADVTEANAHGSEPNAHGGAVRSASAPPPPPSSAAGSPAGSQRAGHSQRPPASERSPRSPRRTPGPTEDEHTSFRPFRNSMAQPMPQADYSPPPEPAPPSIVVHTPAQASVTPFAPLTPERIQAQLDAAREARRVNRVQEDGYDPAPPPPPAWRGGPKMIAHANWVPRDGEALAMASTVSPSKDRHVSWPFALAAMAIIGSLATVVIVQASGDDLIRTGASFVDPAVATRGDGPREGLTRPVTPSTQPISVLDLPPAAPNPGMAPAVMAPAAPAVMAPAAPAVMAPSVARVEPAPRAAPPVVEGVVVASPEPRRTAASGAEVKKSAPAKAPTASVTHKAAAEKPAKAAAAKKGVTDEDVVNAAAADALARAQLQQSL